MNSMLQLMFLFITTRFSIGLGSLVVVILSQSNRYHADLAEGLREDIHEQADYFNLDQPTIHLTHQDFPHVGAWTILPILSSLFALHGLNSSWIVFVEDRTKLKLNHLVDTINKYDHRKELFVGYALQDREPSIIHHFAFYENPKTFSYPNIGSGFAITTSLLKRLNGSFGVNGPRGSDFSIDSAYELALYIWADGTGRTMHHDPAFCIAEGPRCAAFPEPFQNCNEGTPVESIYFAVKTCEKFHKSRLPVVKRTWAKFANRIHFFSDVRDETIPTISLGIPNTENGHCGKTMAIMKYAFEEVKGDEGLKWIVVADDDTILSVYRLQQLLSCYDSSSAIALGERYGFNVHNSRGYNYITGGGGMVFSRALLEVLMNSGKCQCPSLSTPDDMYIGLCLANLGIIATHSPLFHQARPVDYATGYLRTDDAISFHKHWMIDPVNVYEEWFADDDIKLTAENTNEQARVVRTEL